MRAWFWTILLVIVAVTIAVLMQRYPGNVLVVVGEWRIQVSLAFGALLTIAAFAALYFLIRLLNWFSHAPARYRGWREDRRQKREQSQLEQGWAGLLEGRYSQSQKILIRLAAETKNRRRRVLAQLSGARAAHEQGQREQRDELLGQARSEVAQLVGDANMNTAVAVAAADLWLDDDQPGRALKALEKLETDPQKHLHLMRLLLRAYEALGMHGKALETARLLLRKDAITAAQARQVIERSASAQLRQIQDKAEWLTFWKSLRTQERLYVDVALAGAAGLQAHGETRDTERLLEQAIKESFDPRLLAAYARAEPDQVSSRLQKAVAWLNQRPEDADLLVTLGALCLTGQMWGQAQRYLELASRQRSDARVHALLGSLYDRIGQPQKAANHWRLATAASAALPVLAQDVYLPSADLADDPAIHHVEGLLLDEGDSDLAHDVIHATGDSIASAQALFPQSASTTARKEAVAQAQAQEIRQTTDDEYYEFFDSAPIPFDGAPALTTRPEPSGKEEALKDSDLKDDKSRKS